jgi:hypothetical protein
MPKDEFDGLPVIDAPRSEAITLMIKSGDLDKRDTVNPDRHPIAIALRRQPGIDDARVSKREALIRRGKKWFRHSAPKRVG